MWVDDCSASSGGSEITLKDWQLYGAVTNNTLIGGTHVDGIGCFEFANYTSWAPWIGETLLKGAQATGVVNPELQFHDKVVESSQYHYNHCDKDQE